MPRYLVKANRQSSFKYTTRTVTADNPDLAIDMVMAEKDSKGDNLFTEVIDVWERVRWIETKREMKSNG